MRGGGSGMRSPERTFGRLVEKLGVPLRNSRPRRSQKESQKRNSEKEVGGKRGKDRNPFESAGQASDSHKGKDPAKGGTRKRRPREKTGKRGMTYLRYSTRPRVLEWLLQHTSPLKKGKESHGEGSLKTTGGGRKSTIPDSSSRSAIW